VESLDAVAATPTMSQKTDNLAARLMPVPGEMGVEEMPFRTPPPFESVLPPWWDEVNEQRVRLIYKKRDQSLSEKENEELGILTARMSSVLNAQVSPPVELLKAMEQELASAGVRAKGSTAGSTTGFKQRTGRLRARRAVQ
jgi:hypothetical protein